MDAARSRRALGDWDDDGVKHQLSLFPRTLRRWNLLFSQAIDRHGRGDDRADCLFDACHRRFIDASLIRFWPSALVVLALVLIPGIGVSRGGARRWIMLAGFAFQPSEFAKLALVFYLAHSMAKKEQLIRTFSIGVLPHLIVGGAFAVMLLLEPDFGTVLILTMLLYFMLFIGGVRVHHLLATALMALPLLIYVMTKAEYRLRRLMSFLDPWSDASGSGFHVIQSLIAFGSGQMWGRGLGESRQKLFYLPEAHTDFVYSVIGEELGLLGALVVLALFGVIIVARSAAYRRGSKNRSINIWLLA